MKEEVNTVDVENVNDVGFIRSRSARTQEWLDERHAITTKGERAIIFERAKDAFELYRKISPESKAKFLETIAEEIEGLGEELIQKAMEESGLPEQRIIGERGRTMNQLRLFAAEVRNGSWVEASIDTAIPDRALIPKPDVRKMLQPIGPVVVFTASNFPLAFSTAGGDTASALAAGNPVIVKAHEGHLGTNKLVSTAILKAAEKTGMPKGVFATVVGKGYTVGEELTKHPVTKAVAFTGSQKGGLALLKYAQEREEPIPVFTEMGSVNPVVLLDGYLSENTEDCAAILANSMAMGVGQFCTQPGIMIGVESKAWNTFKDLLSDKVNATPKSTMLNQGIGQSYVQCVDSLELIQELDWLVKLKEKEPGNVALAEVNFKDFLGIEAIRHEVFGPFSLLVTCTSIEEISDCLKVLKGQLTTTFFGLSHELESNKELVSLATVYAGRVLFNGAPTGVEVCPSMHHGGVYPSTSDSRFTSVGADAIKRFARPVCYQNCPQVLLPDALKDGNPLKIWRKLNNEFSQS